MQSMERTGRNRKQCSKLRLVPITKLTIDDLFCDDYQREMMSHEEFSFLGGGGGGRLGGGYSAQSAISTPSKL